MAARLLAVLILAGLGPTNTASEDRAALLTFLAGIEVRSRRALPNWGSPSLCNWTGVSCRYKSPLSTVVKLDLGGLNLRGTMSPWIANLSALEVLDLSHNLFVGRIPPELGSLANLRQLSLSSNLLAGTIPPELGVLNHLVYLDLGGNRLAGEIPKSLFCNSTNSMRYIDLSDNSLRGEIPLGVDCRLVHLQFLLLWSNELHGQIPLSLSNSSQLEWIDLESNYLGGGLPPHLFDKFPNLLILYLSYNNHTSDDLDPFLVSLSNCSQLQELELAANNLHGVIPPSVGALSVNLSQLHLEENFIAGPIHPNISSLVNLTYLNLSNNVLNGSIPPEISGLRRLERLYLSNNRLTGEIPSSIGEIHHLGLLDISSNDLSGTIPDTFAELSQLRWLLLHHNRLSGPIPVSLGGCTNLEKLDLSHNQLTGRIPAEVAGLQSLKLYLNLSNNKLQGHLPMELSKMDMVLALDLSSNNISGIIPPQLTSCVALEYLNLSSNDIVGQLPRSIGTLPYLKVLDLSCNRVTGGIPDSLASSSTLRKLNLSVNNFTGVVPKAGVFNSLPLSSIAGNPYLCGHIAGMKPCTTNHSTHHHSFLRILLPAIGTPCLLLFLLVGYPTMKKRPGIRKCHLPSFRRPVLERNGDAEIFHSRSYPRISYRELVEATGGFSERCLVGSGRFGRVYEGTLRGGEKIAVKVLDLKTGGGDTGGSFKRECEVLGRTRHRNLIGIVTACSRPDFKALVLPLMPNGSLERWLYPTSGERHGWNLEVLVSVATDVAEGMAYLHHYSPVRVVHCDLKPSNVLLDRDMTAVVADFGIARLVKGGGSGEEEEDGGDAARLASCGFSTAGLLHGSVGYIAPEYGLGGHPSTNGDVYSFGVLLLEIITGKRPTDVIFHEGLTLHEWVRRHYPHNLESVLMHPNRLNLNLTLPSSEEENLPYRKKVEREVIIELVELGLACTQHTPSMRPTMADIAHEMAALKHELALAIQPEKLLDL
ncbi:hypothetical protein HPP92_015872 [Vanilla planifolia]|uniref:non-specific serine/threonine protein kinase n=1 Tax=Vanilla planifolia TaxID=51239 RepID=A0A835QPH4_VANPL|nr:hypothetical protein HPP92_015872 [Vanilla planifolia]